MRVLLFLFAAMVMCPVRYWPILQDVDNTWVFALNYAAAHGGALGRDVVWSTGPLGYLVFPQDIGANLSKALLFQFAVWAVLSGILADLYFRSGITLRNLAAFSLFLGLSAPWYWFNYMGTENLLIAGILILLVLVRLRGGMVRYLLALVLIGIVPLIKFTGGAVVAGALGGFLLDRILLFRRRAAGAVALGAIVPIAVAALICAATMPSMEAFRTFLSGTSELAAGYAAAMSASGRPVELFMGAEILVLFCGLLALLATDHAKQARFVGLLLAGPMLVSLKHGFVRQDFHILNFLCFSALAIGLTMLPQTWVSQSRTLLRLAAVLPFLILWQDYAYNGERPKVVHREVTGTRGVRLAWDALFHNRALGQKLRRRAEAEFRSRLGAHLEPEIRSIIGGSPVASMSIGYTSGFLEGLNLRIYPVIQRYAAYTPFLDGLNAEWIREHGPRFLIFDGHSVDHRHPWVETPAMWLEVYRWYDTRWSGSRNLLLERRAEPRFRRLAPVQRLKISRAAGLHLPPSGTPVFWTMNCALSAGGRIRELLLRMPPVYLVTNSAGGPRRVLMRVIGSPVMGNFLPKSLEEFAAVFEDSRTPRNAVDTISLQGAASAYAQQCDVELLSPAGD